MFNGTYGLCIKLDVGAGQHGQSSQRGDNGYPLSPYQNAYHVRSHDCHRNGFQTYVDMFRIVYACLPFKKMRHSRHVNACHRLW